MILNERQYKIASSQLQKLSKAVDSPTQDEQVPDWVREAQASAIRSQIDELEREMREYQLLRTGKRVISSITDLGQLALTLIEARIAKGMTQSDLADRLGLNERQIQRYEASGYAGASLTRLAAIAKELGVGVQETWQSQEGDAGDTLLVWQDARALDWSKFPLKEMLKRHWIRPQHMTSPIDAVREFFLSAAGEEYATALHRKKYHGRNRPDEYSLLAWQARVVSLARKVVETGRVPQFDFRDDWIRELSRLSIEDDGPLRAKDFLRERGILLVVVEHLPGTYLDGAAMSLDSGNPVVALTLRYDRLDHFWFVLMHELGHVFSHLRTQLGMDYFDDEDNGVDDSIEREADQYALNALIPEKDWNRCLSRFTVSAKAVEADASRIGIHPSIVAGRIRRESNNYTILNELVGQNAVRRLFEVSDEDS